MTIINKLAKKEGKPPRVILQELFELHGSQSAVARALGVSQSTVSYWLLKEGLEQKTVLVEREVYG